MRLGDERVRLAVDDLPVLQNLPLEPPYAAFAGRLAKVQRENGGWVVHLSRIAACCSLTQTRRALYTA